MKRLNTLLCALVVSMAMAAQTMNIEMGQVTHAYKAADTGRMTYSDGQSFSVNGLKYAVADVTAISVDNSSVDEATVKVNYDGNTATVRVSGDVAPFITASVKGAHVVVLASNDLTQEVTYTLSGASEDGSFYMDGELKATFELNGLSLTNPDSAAINIQCGKRLKFKLADGTTNYLADGLRTENDGSDAHKAAVYFQGHSEWSGGGTITIQGNVKHAVSGHEYVEFGKKLGTVIINTAKGDGIHANEYFEMKGGKVTINSSGDGIDLALDPESTEEQNGQIIISGGTLEIASTGDASKGMKCDGNMLISGGTINISTTGAAVFEEDENDLSSSACAKPDGTFTMTGGTVTLTSTGDGGKGLNADGTVTISGGELTIVTTGDVYEYGELDSKPHAVKSDGNIILEGGTVLSCASAESGNAFKTDAYVLTNGATLMGIGNKKTTPDATSTCAFKNYSNIKVVGGEAVSYDGVSFTIPSIYSNSSAKILVSSPTM